MNKFLSIVALATSVVLISCSKDKDDELDLKGKNSVAIEFDNGFDGESFELGNEYESNTERIKPTALDYIVGNFVLVNKAGKEVKTKGFYIISEGGKNEAGKDKVKNAKLELKGIPAGNYTKIKFGIGVDPETYKNETAITKESGKSSKDIDFWVEAEKYDLTWNWTSGYKNLAFEGTFTNVRKEQELYKIHIASEKLYQVIELELKNVIVAYENSPQIHIMVDAYKILGGKTKIQLSEAPTLEEPKPSEIMMGPKAKKIKMNFVDGMFTVDHSHNSGTHH